MNSTKEKWHSEAADIVLSKLGSGLNGLSLHEAKKRLKLIGSNVISIEKRYTTWQRFVNQFHNVLIYVLLTASIITAFLQQWIDTGVILGAVILNALIGFIQEGRAENAIDALKQMLSLQAHVIRASKNLHIDAKELVPGDIVLLHPGDKVPADLRLLKSKNLQIQEAILTGESLPVEKNTQRVPENTPLAERFSMAYSGTFVTYGTAVGIVTATGESTEIGRISMMLRGASKLTTPLLRQMAIFSRWLAAAILLFALVIFLFGFFVRHYPIDEMFLAAVAIAVSAIPEGLPAVMTIILALGVTRMAKHHAIIRRLPAVETLSSVTVICTDKTGTLTKNELTVQHIVTADNNYLVSGSGYNADGKITAHHQEVNLDSHPDLLMLVKAGILCNEASLHKENESWHLYGNPIDGALLALGFKADIDYNDERYLCHKIDFIPFESLHKFMASMHHDHKGHAYVYVKGAPERILEMCSNQFHNHQQNILDKPFWHSQINKLAQNGMRVLALAYRPTEAGQTTLLFKDVEKNLTFLGIIGIVDPPRDETSHAVAQCQKAGIRVKMITGDHRETACAIGKQVGIDIHHVLTGENLDAIDDKLLVSIVNDVDIYARTTPDHKLRLIKALRENKHIIAMTGDGVNDAPALQHADIGIAMGKKGTDVTREAAEIVLADDNFASIEQAVKESRTVYDNLKKVIMFLLPNDAGEGFSIFLAILFGYTLPITPLQILWVNLVTAVTLGLALAFEPSEKNIMSKKPRDPHETLLSWFLMWRIGFVSFLFVSAMFGLFIFETQQGADIAFARTLVVNVLVLAEAFYLINCRKIYDSVLNWNGIFGNTPILISIVLVLIFQIGFTYLPFMQSIFNTRSINLNQWGLIVFIAVVIFLTIEIEKFIIRLFKT